MNVAVAIVLACTAGYVDALTYLAIGAFVANVTGNTVFLAMAIVTAAWASASKHGGALAAFVLGAMAGRTILRRWSCPRCALAAGACLILLSAPLRGLPRLVVLATAMGMQDAAVMRFGGTSINTVFVSGDLVQFGDAVANLGATPMASRKAWHLGGTWLAYLGGAAAGTVAARMPSHARVDWRLILAACVIAAIAMFATQRDRESVHVAKSQ